MYCSTCGVAVAQDLSYCNFCGAKLTGVSAGQVVRAPEVKPELLVSAMVVVFVLGLLAITVMMGVMKTVLDVSNGQIFAFMLLCFLTMLFVEGVCTWLLLRRKRGPVAADAMLSPGQTTRELDPARPGELLDHRPSVTENTTRAFDPVYNKRTSE